MIPLLKKHYAMVTARTADILFIIRLLRDFRKL